MRRGRFIAACGALVALAAAPCFGDEAGDMAKAVNGFYGAYATFHPSDGIPDAKGRARYAPFVTPALERLLAESDGAEQHFAAANKDSPPLIEGDLFTSNFEGATSYKVGACVGDASIGHCDVALTYDDRKDDPKDKPITWNDTVYLSRSSAGWRIDDIGYGASWAFANKGRLTGTLHDAISEAAD
jgi:hypothetical protein